MFCICLSKRVFTYIVFSWPHCTHLFFIMSHSVTVQCIQLAGAILPLVKHIKLSVVLCNNVDLIK